MKILGFWTILIGLTLTGCTNANKLNQTENQDENLTNDLIDGEKDEIQKLVRQVLNWADSEKSIDLLPVLSDRNDSIYIGFDIERHKQNLKRLKETDFFSAEFIENYNQIILTLDKGIKNGNYDVWYVGDMPTFIFAGGANPWCDCQDNMEWSKVEVRIKSLDEKNGQLQWYWGNLGADTDDSWKEFGYDFSVMKVNNKWKIAYMRGFDYQEATRRDGQ